MRSIRTIKGKAATNEHIWSGLACLKANPQVKNFRRFGKGKAGVRERGVLGEVSERV